MNVIYLDAPPKQQLKHKDVIVGYYTASENEKIRIIKAHPIKPIKIDTAPRIWFITNLLKGVYDIIPYLIGVTVYHR